MLSWGRTFVNRFFSKSSAEFWRRWHITLGNWFKDYIYVPVSTSSFARNIRRSVSKRFGNRASKAVMTAFPLAAVWLLTGIWHGTGFNYILWGLYWGMIIFSSTLLEEQYGAVTKKLRILTGNKLWECFQILRTFSLYCIGLLPLLAGSTKKGFWVLQRILSKFDPSIFWNKSLYSHGLGRRDILIVLLSISLLLFVNFLQERMNVRQEIAKKNIVLRWIIYYCGIFAVLIFGVYGAGSNTQPFMYENF